MITEISRKNAKKHLYIFPEVNINTYDIKDPKGSSLELSTWIEIDGYVTSFRKKYEYKGKLDYKKLMEFIDALQVDVNRLKKNFNIEKTLELFKESVYIGIMKIIE